MKLSADDRQTDSLSPVSLSQNLFPIFDSRNRRFEMKNRETYLLMQNSQVLHQTEKRRNLRLSVMQKFDAHLALLLIAIHVGTEALMKQRAFNPALLGQHDALPLLLQSAIAKGAAKDTPLPT